jgi:hypothetical protein
MFLDQNTIYIPLGIRCSSATALQYSGLRTYSFPFDWCQMKIDTMCEIINLPDDEIVVSNFVENIVNKICPITKMNAITGDWFPHDDFPNDISRYTRRILRMNNLINNSTDQLVFITTFGVLNDENIAKFQTIRNCVVNKLKTTHYLFLCVSATSQEYYDANTNTYFANLCVGTDKDAWDTYEKNVGDKIKNLLAEF